MKWPVFVNIFVQFCLSILKRSARVDPPLTQICGEQRPKFKTAPPNPIALPPVPHFYTTDFNNQYVICTDLLESPFEGWYLQININFLLCVYNF
jgi:hypothetical protein